MSSCVGWGQQSGSEGYGYEWFNFSFGSNLLRIQACTRLDSFFCPKFKPQKTQEAG
jgi:hypothetical protein